MPAASKAQQRYFGMLYAKKKSGNLSGLSDKDKKVMQSMKKQDMRDYAKTKHDKLPNKLAEYAMNYGYMQERTDIYDMDKDAGLFTIAKTFAKPVMKAVTKIAPKTAPALRKAAPQVASKLKGYDKALVKATRAVKTKIGIKPGIAKTVPGVSAPTVNLAPNQMASAVPQFGASSGVIGGSVDDVAKAIAAPAGAAAPVAAAAAAPAAAAADKIVKAPGLWGTRIRWGLGGVGTGMVAGGALSFGKGTQPNQKYYG